MSLHQDQALVDYLADRLVSWVNAFRRIYLHSVWVRSEIRSLIKGCTTYKNYPDDLYAKPGDMIANRSALQKWGAWINAFGAQEYKRPLFLACSADLADSTMISGFAKPYGDFEGYGVYERPGTPEGVLLPQEITEFANAGILAGAATVNFAPDPVTDFDGFWGAFSTYGSFSYLKYGMLAFIQPVGTGL